MLFCCGLTPKAQDMRGLLTAMKLRRLPLAVFCLVLLVWGCTPPGYRPDPNAPPEPGTDPVAGLIATRPAESATAVRLPAMGYSIQVGAFIRLDNAVRLEQRLEADGIDAYHFRHKSGLYKVRFGNHARYQAARTEAERLQARGRIDAFFIVRPGDYAAARIRNTGRGNLRAELVDTARRFIGIPYRWGGTTAENGFDCSGLTMVSYRLNGLDLPRVSRSQFRAGRQVAKNDLRPGDLVFFATKGGRRVTHVGMYAGNDRFIHAPRPGKKVREEKLSNDFFARTYVGGRSYL